MGADIILQQLDKGVQRIRQGFLVDGKTPVREGAIIVNIDRGGDRLTLWNTWLKDDYRMLICT